MAAATFAKAAVEEELDQSKEQLVKKLETDISILREKETRLKERIAKDAAASVQSALQKGLVAGGGAAELAVARQLEQNKNALSGMAVFGADCVIAALKKPFMQMIANAGFNPLEKHGDVNRAQELQQNHHLSINCDTGRVEDLYISGIVDPLYVKLHGLKTAGEVAEAILRINIIVKKKEYQPT